MKSAPELFDALAVLRTEELLAAHRLDGAEQYFTRAVDFGYSFSRQETFDLWGRDAILGDFVRMIRTVRPEVVTGSEYRGTGRRVNTTKRPRCWRVKRMQRRPIPPVFPSRSTKA